MSAPHHPHRSVRPPDLTVDERAAIRGEEPEPRRRPAWLRPLVELPVLLVIAIAIAVLIQTFVAQAYFIPSGSMQPTFAIDDRVIVEKVSMRLRDPERGEVVVFRRPGVERPRGITGALRPLVQGLGITRADEEIDLIKRVIGLPGETVELREGLLLVDGVGIAEDYAVDDARDLPPLTLDGDSYLMLGDNRPSSDDSRFSIGPVPRDAIIGRAVVIAWPLGRATTSLTADYELVPDGPHGAGGDRGSEAEGDDPGSGADRGPDDDGADGQDGEAGAPGSTEGVGDGDGATGDPDEPAPCDPRVC